MASSFEGRQQGDVRPVAFVGASRALLPAFVQVGRLGATDAPLLILGEPGTGKALLARLVHDYSARRDEPFTVVSHGAPLVVPDRGTLLIDEITALNERDQLTLLALVSAHHDRRTDAATGREVRVIAASAVPEHDETLKGRVPAWRLGAFAEGLITLPPLRKRAGDLGRLAAHFAAEWAAESGTPVPRLAPDSVALLEAYPWPGNVPELRATLRKALDATGATGQIQAHTLRGFLPADVREPLKERDAVPTLREVRRDHIHRAVVASGGDLDAAARALGIDRAVLTRVLRHIEQQVADRPAVHPAPGEELPDPDGEAKSAP